MISTLIRHFHSATPKMVAATTFMSKDLKIHPVEIKKIKPDRPGQF